jgi:hypothetical protein
MKTLFLTAVLAAIPAFATTGSNAPDYYRQPSPSAQATRLERTDGNRMPSSAQAGSLLQAPADVHSNDNPAPRLDGNRTPGMFGGDRR